MLTVLKINQTISFMNRTNRFITFLFLIAPFILMSCNFTSDNSDNKSNDNKLIAQNDMDNTENESSNENYSKYRASLFRTDFSENVVWSKIYAEFMKPDPISGLPANLNFCLDKKYNLATPESIIEDLKEYDFDYFFIVDSVTINNKAHPVLCIGLGDNLGQKFRSLPSEINLIDANLSISNMNFEEFVSSVDSDGVFRGF